MPQKIQYAISALRIYAWVLVVLGVLGLITFVGAILLAGSSQGAGGALAEFGVIFSLVIPFVLIFIAAYVVPSFIAISGIKQQKEWGRIVGIIMGIIFLFSFPFGTIAGAFVLYGLFSSEAQAWFKTGTPQTPTPPATPQQ